MTSSKLSPENYLRTRARSIPLGDCYINQSWQETGMASIIITRKHITGNLTIGFFEVDLYCLGVKDAFWKFNAFPDIIEEIMAHQKENIEPENQSIPVDYVLAHNIIYGAVEYAEELGFMPHKGFKLAKYILEEDDDKIELIDIEFGLNGRPAVFIGKETHPSNILATLDKNVGSGNYTFISEDGLEDFSEEEDEEENEDFIIDKPLEEYKTEDFEQVLQGKRAMAPESYFLFSFTLARQIIDKNERKQIDKILQSVEKWDVEEDDSTEEDQFVNDEEKQNYYKLYQEMIEDAPKAIPEIKQAIKDFPGSFQLRNLLGMAYVRASMPEELYLVSEDLFRKFPGNILATCNYLNRLILNGKIDEAENLVHREFDIHKQFPEKSKYSSLEYLSYLSVLINYTLAKEEIIKAAAYAYCLTQINWLGEYREMADELYQATSGALFKILVPKDIIDNIPGLNT